MERRRREQKKIRVLQKQIDVFEKERCELIGQPTSIDCRPGFAKDAKERWNRKHGIVTEQKQAVSKSSVPTKSNTDKIPWGTVGMATNELKNKNAELKRQNKELQKAIDKINKTK